MAVRIYIVDDDPGMLAMLGQLLSTALPAEVEPFGSGDAALARCAVERPALVISDLCMPGMSGARFLATVHERWPGVPAVLVTGHLAALRQDRWRIRAGICHVLEKPFRPAALLDCVRALLALGPAPGPAASAGLMQLKG